MVVNSDDDTGGGEVIVDQNIPFLFSELLELTEYSDGVKEWKETVRWVKFEEAVEEAGNRWSKPHVATPSLHGMLHLRRLLKSGIVLHDLEAQNLHSICNSVMEVHLTQGDFSRETGTKLRDIYLLKHRHQFEGPRKVETGLGTVIKDLLVQKLESKKITRSGSNTPLYSRRGSSSVARAAEDVTSNPDPMFSQQPPSPKRQDSEKSEDGKVNLPFLKKLPEDAEAAVILTGVVSFLEKPISAFIRLTKPVVLGDLPEVDIPTRYLYFLVGPAKVSGHEIKYTEIGQSMGSALSDKTFVRDLYESDCKEDVVVALDDYMDSIKTLPRDWNPKQYIEPPKGEDEKERELQVEEHDVIDDDRRNREASGLVRSGRLFGGLINDFKRKAPNYISDFTDGFHTQCVSSFLFLYFACLAPIVAFGALLGEATEQRIATIEGLVAGLLSGVLFSLFSGQPLNLLGSTGPVYVFEKILYEMCTDQSWDYLSLRLWIGIWVGVMLILLVAFDASAYVCYITRFTEELFATLVAFIFIMSAFKNTFGIKKDVKNLPCFCTSSTMADTYPDGELSANMSALFNASSSLTLDDVDEGVNPFAGLSREECILEGGSMVGVGCDHGYDVYLMSLVLFFGSFLISIVLKQFRTTGYFPAWVRNFLSDFAVIIGILTMTAIDYFTGLPTPKLNVPSEFKPTWDQRSWLVTHALIFPDHVMANPWWVDMFLAPVFAILATILIFMDQQITAVIVNRKEYKLKKGCGYHLDLLVLAIIIIISSVFGLPWFIANTIPSINHMQSLTKESTTSIPGEKPQFLGIREQRLTSLFIAILTGLSVLMTPLLALLPMPVLYGVFLFMGVSSLRGLQFFDRILLLFMPTKNQPNYVYLKYVPLSRVHLFTLIELLSLAGLWAIKSYPATSISFPIMLVVICVIRKMIECLFSNQELRALDDLLPEFGKGKRKRNSRIPKDLEDVNESSEDENSEATKKLNSGSMNGKKQKSYSRADILDEELEELMKSHIRTRLPRASRSLSVAKSPTHSRPRTPPRLRSRRVILFARLEGEEIYTPLQLCPITLENLIKSIKNKFPSLRDTKIERLMQRSRKGITFPLEDPLLEYLEDHQVFVLKQSPGDSGIHLTFLEQTLD